MMDMTSDYEVALCIAMLLLLMVVCPAAIGFLLWLGA